MDKFEVMKEYNGVEDDMYSNNSNEQKVKNFLRPKNTRFFKFPKTVGGKKIMIKCFTSGSPGNVIRNAITGVPNEYKHKVGSFNEEYYFSS